MQCRCKCGFIRHVSWNLALQGFANDVRRRHFLAKHLGGNLSYLGLTLFPGAIGCHGGGCADADQTQIHPFPNTAD